MSDPFGTLRQVGRGAEDTRTVPDSFGERWAAAMRNDEYTNIIGGADKLRREEMKRRLQEIEDQTGTRLPNPYKDRFEEVDERAIEQSLRAQIMAGPAQLSADVGRYEKEAARRAALEARIDALAASYPDIETADRYEARVRERAAVIEGAAADGGFAGFLGSVSAGVIDPVNIATLPFAASGKTILQVALREAALNAGIETAVQPLVQAQRADLGLSSGFDDALANVAAAGAFGGVIGGAGKSIEVLLTRLNTARNDDIANTILGADVPLPPDIHAGGIAAQRDAETDAALGVDDTEVDAQREMLEGLKDVIEATQVGTPITSLPERPSAVTQAAREVWLADNQNFGFFDARTLLVDAKRFQFKEGGDAAGVTDALLNIKKWDDIKAGEILVWVDRNGSAYVADGHQRTGLARRLMDAGQDNIRVRGVILREADGISAEDARAIAAAKNIAQGTGTVIDAAKVLRVRPDLLDGTLSPRTAGFKVITGLTRLGDDAFGMVINDVIEPAHAAIVGRLVDDPAEQVAIAGILARANVNTLTEAEAMVRDALHSGFVQSEQRGLFGTDAVGENLLAERAAILSNAIQRLRRDKRLFATLNENADRIEDAGNSVNVDANREIAQNADQIAAIVLRTAYVNGPVSDALRRASELATNGRSRRAATDGFLDTLRQLGPRALIELDGLGNTARAARGNDEIADAGGATAQAAFDLAPTTHTEFADPVAAAPVNAARAVDDLFGEAPPADDLFVGTVARDGEEPEMLFQSAEDFQKEIEQEDAALDRLRGCVK